MEEIKDEQAESSSALQAAVASSPEVQQEAQANEAQSPTAEKGVVQEQVQEQKQEEVPFHHHPRFKELTEENRWLKQNMEQIIQQRTAQQQFQQPTQDPYAGMTLEEKAFWQNIDQRIEKRAKAIADERLLSINPMLEAGAKEIANIKVQEFRKAHPDIKPNSPEEYEIAKKINEASRIGYTLTPDEAYWSVMGPKGIKVAQEQGKQQFKQQVEVKRKANVEVSSSVPIQAQAQPKKSFRQMFAENLEKAERGEL